MDRNEIDCNRLSQIAARAPWMLDLIADRVSQIVDRHGRATVLLIHGWNVIEPRIDFGLGLRHANGRLRPPAGAHVSASDNLSTDQWRRFSYTSTRPASFRHSACAIPAAPARTCCRRSPSATLKARSAPCGVSPIWLRRRVIDALQLEMSVAVRLAGGLRTRGIAALTEVFGGAANVPLPPGASAQAGTIVVDRTPRTTVEPKAAVSAHLRRCESASSSTTPRRESVAWQASILVRAPQARAS